MRLAVISVILACGALVAAPGALADGDPASDVLVSLPYFDPIGLTLPAATSARLAAVLEASAAAGAPIRVAMISSPTALGTVAALWEQPQTYAHYLQTELSLDYDGQVLVVMPNGFGLAGPASGPHSVTPAERAVRAPAPGAGVKLATSALTEIPRLAAATRHPIPSPSLSSADHARAAVQRSTAKTLSTAGLLALLIGSALIGLCWRVSLSRRPLSTRRGLRA